MICLSNQTGWWEWAWRSCTYSCYYQKKRCRWQSKDERQDLRINDNLWEPKMHSARKGTDLRAVRASEQAGLEYDKATEVKTRSARLLRWTTAISNWSCEGWSWWVHKNTMIWGMTYWVKYHRYTRDHMIWGMNCAWYEEWIVSDQRHYVLSEVSWGTE